jgi:hypothetical protein
MERTFDCPESGEKCNRRDCSIKYCADRKDLEARAAARAHCVLRDKRTDMHARVLDGGDNT